MLIVFVLIIAIILALWWGLGQHNAASLERLEATGFRADHILEAQPPVALDEGREKIAFLTVHKVLVYDYDQVLGWDWESTERAGWQQKSEPTVDYALVFYLQDPDNPSLRVSGFGAEDVARWRSRLEGLAAGAAGRP